MSSGLLMASPEHAELAAYLRKERTKLRVALRKRVEEDVRAGIMDASANAANLARFYTTVLQGMSVQAIDGATQVDLAEVMETALLSWPSSASLSTREH